MMLQELWRDCMGYRSMGIKFWLQWQNIVEDHKHRKDWKTQRFGAGVKGCWSGGKVRQENAIRNKDKTTLVEGEIDDFDKIRNQNKRHRVQGHVEVEDLWRMKRCLVGVIATVCSVSSILSRLHDWGLGEIKVQRTGGKWFLLSLEDDELYLMLEDLQWSYLEENNF
ncbi:hypothetical protein V6N13_008306 [Hibiscus sabdariffa]